MSLSEQFKIKTCHCRNILKSKHVTVGTFKKENMSLQEHLKKRKYVTVGTF